jgi:hypothetical protein
MTLFKANRTPREHPLTARPLWGADDHFSFRPNAFLENPSQARGTKDNFVHP